MTGTGPMTRAVADSLKAASIADRDRAGVQLARRYAQLLDAARGDEGEADLYNDLGPKLLATLTALGLTPAGRGLKGGGADGVAGASKLDELRARRGAG
jgi:hypothetical protein